MESNFEEVSAEQAAEMLANLRGDREQLASNTSVPISLMAAYGGIAAWFVANAIGTNPGANYEAPSNYWLLLVAVLVVSYLVRRETGIKFRTVGSVAWLAVVGIVVTCLVLFSVSLALVSLGLPWAVIFTSLGAFGIVTYLARLAFTSTLSKLNHV